MYERFKKLLDDNNVKASEIAKTTGIPPSTFSDWKVGRSRPKLDKIKKIADYFGVSYLWLSGDTDDVQSKETHNKAIKIPILGTVIAGIPISAIEEIIGWEEISPKLASQGEYFALVIKGDSMSPTMDAGDVVIVRKQQEVNSGDIAIVCINGDEATCKKIIKHKDGISLVSLNSKYEPMYYDKNDIADKPIHIIGKVVELRRRF